MTLHLAPDDRWSSSVIRDLLNHARRDGVVSLAGGLPAAEALPVARIHEALDDILTNTGASALQYGVSQGEPTLVRRLAAGDQPDRVLVTAGSQQGLDLLGRVLSHPDHFTHPDHFAASRPIAIVDEPGYVGAMQVLRTHGYALAGVPVDDAGMRVDVLADRLAGGLRPRLCYTNPSFQNPTGATLCPERGAQLVALAEQYQFVVIADDPYAELYLDDAPPTQLPGSPFVVHLGSMSKVISPGLRIGWINGEPELISRLELAKQATDLQTSTLNQLLVANLISDDEWWSTHLSSLRSLYRGRRSALLEAVSSHAGTAVVAPQHGGFFLWLDLGHQIDTSALLTPALGAGVAFVPGSAFTTSSEPTSQLRLSYSNGDPATFEVAVRRLTSQATEQRRGPQGQ